MSKMKKLFLALALLLLAGRAEATTYTAATCNYADVKAKTDIALDGDTVNIPAGTCTWTSTLGPLTKGITLMGAGIDVTIIQDNKSRSVYPYGTLIWFQVVGTTKSWRVSSMTLQDGGATSNSSNATITGEQNSHSVRIDHIKFNDLRARFIWLTGDIRGVADHNTFFTSHNQGTFQLNNGSTWNGIGNYGDNSWATPTNFGSADFFFIEDNTFTATTLTGGIDSVSGARWVARHNVLDHMVFTTHGTDSTNRTRGTRAVEMYNNTVTIPAGAFNAAMGFRSGTGLVHDNTISGFNGQFMTVGGVFRERDNFTPFGTCDGTSPYDNNDNTVYVSGFHTGASGVPAILTDSTKNFTTACLGVSCAGNGYSIRNVTGAWGSFVSAVTTTTLTATNSAFGQSHNWNNGDSYEVRKVYPCLDQPGRGQGDLLSGVTPAPGWPHQALEPIYSWNNTLNGATESQNSGHFQIGRDIIVGGSGPVGYTPFTYPHPLTGGIPPLPTPIGISFSPSSATVLDNIASGTLMTTFTVTMSDGSAFAGTTSLTANPGTIASIVGSTLKTARTLSGADDGIKTFTVQATQNSVSVSGNFVFTINTTPIPSTIAFSPASPSLQEDAVTGAFVSNITVTTSNGSAFTGSLSITANPGTTVALSGSSLVLARNLVHADVGTLGPFTVRATENGTSITNNISITVTAIAPPPPPVPVSIGFTPTSLSVFDNTTSGTTLATFVVTMSDGSTFSGSTSLTANPGSIASIVGSSLKTARNLTGGDDGAQTITLQATQNSTSVHQDFVLTVNATPPPPPPSTPVSVIFTPSAPVLRRNNVTGDLISTVSVVMNDLSTFSGTLTLTANPGSTAVLVGNVLQLNRDLTQPDIGNIGPFTVQATENSVSVSGDVTLKVIGGPPNKPSNLVVH